MIAFHSKSLSKSERNYCVIRKELLAVVVAVKTYHHYLCGRQFLIRTDHGALKWLQKFKNPEGQLARWLELLGTYDFNIQHRSGICHGNADALSRRPCADTVTVPSKRESALQPQIQKQKTLFYVVHPKAPTKPRMGIACHFID